MKLKYERVQRGWSQARVAELLGTDAGNVSRWERGYSVPSPYFREKLCQLYEKNALELGLLTAEQIDNCKERDETAHLNQNAQGHLINDMSSREYRPSEAEIIVSDLSSRILACISYALGWLTGFLVLLFKRSNHFVIFHAIQSICFLGCIHLIILFCAFTSSWADHAIWLIVIRDVCGPLAVLVGLIGWITGLIQAARGRYYRLPLLGKYCARLALFVLRTQREESGMLKA